MLVKPYTNYGLYFSHFKRSNVHYSCQNIVSFQIWHLLATLETIHDSRLMFFVSKHLNAIERNKFFFFMFLCLSIISTNFRFLFEINLRITSRYTVKYFAIYHITVYFVFISKSSFTWTKCSEATVPIPHWLKSAFQMSKLKKKKQKKNVRKR